MIWLLHTLVEASFDLFRYLLPSDQLNINIATVWADGKRTVVLGFTYSISRPEFMFATGQMQATHRSPHISKIWIRAEFTVEDISSRIWNSAVAIRFRCRMSAVATTLYPHCRHELRDDLPLHPASLAPKSLYRVSTDAFFKFTCFYYKHASDDNLQPR